jgi:hypothetical protein
MPLINQIRQNRVLTNISIDYRPGNYISGEVLPRVPVAQESDIYYIYDFASFQIPETLREPRARYNQIDWTVSTDTYFAQEYGLEQPIDDRERRNAVGLLDLERDSTRILTANLLNARERRTANLVKATASYPAGHSLTLAGAAKWTDPTSDPMGDLSDARVKIQSATGLLPTDAVIGYNVFEALMVHPDIQAFVGEGGLLTEQVLARLWRLERVHVGSVLYNTAPEGQAVNLGDLWANDVVIYHRAPAPALRTPSFGYQFVAADFRTFTYRNEEITSDIIRVNEVVAEKLTAPKLGFVIKGAAGI